VQCLLQQYHDAAPTAEVMKFEPHNPPPPHPLHAIKKKERKKRKQKKKGFFGHDKEENDFLILRLRFKLSVFHFITEQ